MLEATPGKPWGIGFKDLLDVEPNMKWRYTRPHFVSFPNTYSNPQTQDRQRAHGRDGIPHHLDNFPTSWITRLPCSLFSSIWPKAEVSVRSG